MPRTPKRPWCAARCRPAATATLWPLARMPPARIGANGRPAWRCTPGCCRWAARAWSHGASSTSPWPWRQTMRPCGRPAFNWPSRGPGLRACCWYRRCRWRRMRWGPRCRPPRAAWAPHCWCRAAVPRWCRPTCWAARPLSHCGCAMAWARQWLRCPSPITRPWAWCYCGCKQHCPPRRWPARSASPSAAAPARWSSSLRVTPAPSGRCCARVSLHALAVRPGPAIWASMHPPARAAARCSTAPANWRAWP